jgi:hypothetical protein
MFREQMRRFPDFTGDALRGIRIVRSNKVKSVVEIIESKAQPPNAQP